MAILVTDDELVAVSAWADRRWDGPLPTVDASQDAALVEAAARGFRSLRLRRLTEGQPLRFVPEAVDLLRAVGARVRVTAHLAPSEAPLDLAGSAMTLLQDDDGWMIDATLLDGVHDIDALPPEVAVLDVLDTALAAADSLPGDLVITVLMPASTGEAVSILVLDGTASRTGTMEGGRFPAPEELEGVTSETATAMLAGACAG